MVFCDCAGDVLLPELRFWRSKEWGLMAGIQKQYKE
jgi:hypothetical protein